MRKVTVIGLGAMGTALARALLAAGHQVTVWNRTAAKAEALASTGAIVAATAAQAIEASPVVITCVRSHNDTRAILETATELLGGRDIVELSSGDPEHAEALAEWLAACGAHCLVGMIMSFPSGIGGAEASITTAGDRKTWERVEDLMGELAGSTSYLGERMGTLAVIFAALFLPRQGYLFGMIYGALLCEKTGVPVDSYVQLIPRINNVLKEYLKVVSTTIPSGDFSDPPASLATIDSAYRDSLATFKALGINCEVPEAMHAIVQRGMSAGLGGEQMTALIKLLR